MPRAPLRFLIAATVSGLGCAGASTLPTPEPVATSPYAAQIDSVATRLFALDAAPGVGIVVVRDSQVIYARGFGFADVEARRPFTAETQFYIASTTKSFTGLAAAMLDLRGTMHLDAPITRYLPTLRLRAPMDADSITVRSLLTHTHGIGDGPVALRLAYTGEYAGNTELVRLMGEHIPNPAGRTYSYTNLGYNVVGLAMDAVNHESWKRTLQRLIFTPLGMMQTSAYVAGRDAALLAMPYQATPTGFERAYYGKTDANMQSAGGLITTPNDMGRWLLAHINGGRLRGRQVLPAAAIAESHRAMVPMSGGSRGLQNIGFGLGWRVSLLDGDTLLEHGGGFTGFATHMSVMPHRRIGVAVMANEGQLGGPFADLIAYAIYDVLRDRRAITADSVAAIGRQLVRARSNIAADRQRRAARPQTLPFPLDAYAGRFFSPVLGHLEISVREGKLEARMGAAWSAVEVYDNTRNQLRVELFGSGAVATVQMKDGQADDVTAFGTTFRRVPWQ